MPTHLHIDPFNGIAGDMFLGAAIDLGVEPDRITHALRHLPLADEFQLTAHRVLRQGVGGVDLQVKLTAHNHEHNHEHKHEHEHSHHPHEHKHHRHELHHHRAYPDIVAMIDALDAAPRARDRARRIVDKLAAAEARVHRKPVNEVHFHEVGAVDSIVDMLGSAVALELLDIDAITCGPLPWTHGLVRCEHGRMPVPAPATAYLIQDMPVIGRDRDLELVTPTGAAILAGVVDAFAPMPPLRIAAIGYGAGDRDDPYAPNLLRLILGSPLPTPNATSFPPPPATLAV